MEFDKNIYDSVASYKNRYRDEHAKNVSEYFENLVKESGVDEAANAKTVKEIGKTQFGIDNVKKSLSRKRSLKYFLIFVIIMLFLIGGGIIYNSITGSPITSIVVVDILISCILFIFAVLLIILITKKINKEIKNFEDKLRKLDEKLKELTAEAWQQTYPLNSLYDWGISEKLFEKTIPLITLDKVFDSKRYDILSNKYRLRDTKELTTSVMYAQSGELAGNPFIIGKNVKHNMISKLYSGSLTISWTERVRKSDGSYTTVVRHDTLRASISKPYPNYFTDSFLIYGNEAAPDLSFSRERTVKQSMSDKDIEKKIKKGSKKIEKKARKSIEKGKNFTAMSDAEFDVLFHALDRDHEVQFRLLFTPLAQKEIVNIIRDRVVGYGDDFDFVKKKMLNVVYPAHLDNLDLNTDPKRYVTYDIAASRKIFNTYNNTYFKSIYFAFAPILAIPLYQQHKPREYIYKDVYESNVCCWEHEAIANGFNQDDLKHPKSDTYNILKTNFVKKTNDVDEIDVTAYGYQGVQEVEYVSMRGGDGYYHQVPVYWTHFYPVEKTSRVTMKVSDQVKRKSFIRNFYGNESWQKFFTKHAGSTNRVQFRRNIVSYLAKNGFTAEDEVELNQILSDEHNNI